MLPYWGYVFRPVGSTLTGVVSRGMELKSGKAEKLPYSLSRWTDVPIAKWGWFMDQVQAGEFTGFDPRTAVPCRWSLKLEDTMGLIFWTKNPWNIVAYADQLINYPLVIHQTLTGWTEVEKGAPDISIGLDAMAEAVGMFGADNVTWRFSPVPLVDDVLERFEQIAERVSRLGLKDVYVAFLQENDLMPETRAKRTRGELLKRMAARSHGLQVLLCNEDETLGSNTVYLPKNLRTGICESGRRFNPTDDWRENPSTEGCGCALAVDPFTINESCTLGCRYCYAADKSLSPRKRNTTKDSLPLVQ